MTRIEYRFVLLLTLLAASLSTGCGGSPAPVDSPAPSPAPAPAPVPGAVATVYQPYLYVANKTSNNVSIYRILPTGMLSYLKDRASSSGPAALAAHPSGKFLLIGYSGVSSVTDFTIDPGSGDLLGGSSIATGNTPGSVVFDASGKYAFSANNVDNTVSYFKADPSTGALDFGSPGSGPVSIPTAATPSWVSVHPKGGYLYSLEFGVKKVTLFTINPADGTIAPVTDYFTGNGPIGMAIRPAGDYAYVVDKTDGELVTYGVGPTGGLTGLYISAVGTEPVSVALHPSGKFVYAVNQGSGDVTSFQINPSTGAPIAKLTTAIGGSPQTISFDPTGAFAYVTNLSSNAIYAYHVNLTTGALSPFFIHVAPGTGPLAGIVVNVPQP